MIQLDAVNIDQTVNRIIAQYGRKPDAVIPMLQALQDEYRYLPEEALRQVCERTDIKPADIIGVSTFYDQFRHRPVGRHMISVCHGTACHVKGAERITEALQRYLGLTDENDTDENGEFTLQKVACLGCCTLAPAVQIDDVTYGHLVPDRIPQMLNDFLEHAKHHEPSIAYKKYGFITEKELGEIRLGTGSCCVSRGSGRVLEALQDAMRRNDIQARIKQVGCVGMCHQTPLIETLPVGKEPHFYACVQAEDAEAILLRHFKSDHFLKRLQGSIRKALDFVLTGETQKSIHHRAIDLREKPITAFLEKQKNIATEFCGQLNPLDLEEYKKYGGFKAIQQVVNQTDPASVIEQIKQSGLRGRGGAGFPAGVKWQKVREANGTPYIICNGDEGDPGAFMDRMIMESYPYRVIEGMVIAAYAVGANQGYFYIRAEYPLAIKRIHSALNRCMQEGILGNNIFGSAFSFNVEIKEGAGAFVCGEESALLASIEGKRGMPRLRPPYPAESGLWEKPTLINNVETYALVPAIVRDGPQSFSSLGTDTSPGTKVFALAGKIARGGLIEVPMGISLRDIVENIGGGVPHGRRLKAVQVGGPSGGCIPAKDLDVPVDYESLAEHGAIMGSGGLVVLDDQDCMVDIARYFLQFTQNQSCGKCTFCRVGTLRMLEILEKLCQGTAREEDLTTLESLAGLVQQGSLCGLGKTAPNPVMTTLRFFRDEYEAHLQGRCPAGKCEALITFTITDQCIGCTLCAQKCPTDAIALKPYEKHDIVQENCVKCGSCLDVCPVHAVRKD